MLYFLDISEILYCMRTKYVHNAKFDKIFRNMNKNYKKIYALNSLNKYI